MQHCRSTSSEAETETESLSCAMDTGESTVVEDSSDVEYSGDTTADDGKHTDALRCIYRFSYCYTYWLLLSILLYTFMFQLI